MVLALMATIFLLTRARTDLKDVSNATVEEEERLQPDNNSSYGTDGTVQSTKQNRESRRTGDAQTKSWLDYLVGLGTVFPFLWSVVFSNNHHLQIPNAERQALQIT